MPGSWACWTEPERDTQLANPPAPTIEVGASDPPDHHPESPQLGMTDHLPRVYTGVKVEGPGDVRGCQGFRPTEVHIVSGIQHFGGRGTYEIRVVGHLDLRWSDWFDGLSISHVGDEETQLTGSVADQAALHGVLHKIRDLGLPLLAVQRIDDERGG